MRHLPYKTESGLCLHGTSQPDQDSVKAGSGCPCSCRLRRMKGVALLEPLSDSLYGIVVSNRLPQTLSRSPWAWREVTEKLKKISWAVEVGSIQLARVGSGLLKKLSQEPTEGLLAAPLPLACKRENAGVLRKPLLWVASPQIPELCLLLSPDVVSMRHWSFLRYESWLSDDFLPF